MSQKKTSPLYRIVKGLVRLVYPKIEVVGTELLPDEPCIVVGNHAQLHSPIACELYFPGNRYIWCAGQMMHLKEVPAYAYQDFWSQKPRYIRWFYKLASYLIAPLSVLVFNNANTIPVYRDTRILATIRSTVEKLQEGASIIIFPEHDEPYNHILCGFQEKFIDVARIYYRKTGKELAFVPMYVTPELRQIHLGPSIRFCASSPIQDERQRITSHLMSEITELACALPRHTVIPYRNLPKRLYPTNLSGEANTHEETRR